MSPKKLNAANEKAKYEFMQELGIPLKNAKKEENIKKDQKKDK